MGIDVGGTFTDIVLQFEDGHTLQSKALSTPGNESEGVLDAIGAVADQAGLDVDALLTNTTVINFGTTVVTNAMLENKGVAVGLITTKGFRDIVELRRGWKEVMFDLKLPPPPTLVRRRWRLGVRERIDVDGEVVVPLDEDGVRDAADRLRDANIRSIAVCFLFSFVNPAHEQRARELIHEVIPDADIHISSEVSPKIREYERFSTTVVNAYVSPLLRNYLRRLTEQLSERGSSADLFVMQSNGGSVSPEIAGRMGCASLLSGPAAGVVAAARVGRACEAPNIIGMDMGGTSYDVSLVKDGVPETHSGGWFNRHWVGNPMLGIHTIGAGGGSIAWIDAGGALRVGPQSAGAQPGPACYGMGGADPTVTDAFLCLGYLNPSFFLGGRMPLFPDKAAAAVQSRIAEPLGMDIKEAAFSILRIVNNNMSNAIRYVSVAKGLDPRDFALMSFGGAGSITVGCQARDLSVGRILVPRAASVLCALGELWTDLKISQIVPMRSAATAVDLQDLTQRLNGIAKPYVDQFTQVSGVDEVRRERAAEFYYEGQSHEILVPIETANGELTAESWASTLEKFHERHQELYAFQMRNKPIEMLSVAQDIVGVRPWEIGTREASHAPWQNARKETRKVCFDIGGQARWLDTPILDGAQLASGYRFQGPAVIEEIDTTVVVAPDDVVTLNAYDVYVIEVSGVDNGAP
jgi:N-methylhydantoinase A